MNKKTIQKCIAVIAVCVMISTSFEGCGKNKEEGSTLNVQFEHSFSSEKLPIDNSSNTFIEFSVGNSLVLSCYDEDYQNEKYYIYTPVDNEVREIKLNYMESLQDGENGYIVFSVPNMEGGVNILFSGYCYKANEEGKEEIKTLDYTLERYDSNMELLTSKKIGDVFEFQNLALNQDNTYYASMWDSETGKQIICTLDEHFKKINEVATIHTNYSLNMIVLRDGSVYVMYPNNSSYLMECGKLNYNTGKIEKIEIEGMPQWTDQVIVSESNDYDFYVYDSTSVYGLRPKDAVCEEVINWTNSDFIGEYVENLLQLSDGRFSLTYKDTVYNTHEVWILSPREKSDINIISLATLGLPDNLNFAVTRYNRSQNKNRIVIYDYGQFNTHENQYKGGLEKFKTDMTSGIVADIINTEGIPYESFCNKGIFTDLNEFMGDITDDRYFTNFFQSLAFGDKLYRVGFNFNISTILAKTEFVGSSSGKTLEEMYEIINNLPEGMDAYQEMSKTSILNSLIANNLEGFIKNLST